MINSPLHTLEKDSNLFPSEVFINIFSADWNPFNKSKHKHLVKVEHERSTYYSLTFNPFNDIYRGFIMNQRVFKTKHRASEKNKQTAKCQVSWNLVSASKRADNEK